MKNRFWLQDFNPLRDLDLPQLVTWIEYGERGYYARLQWLYRAIEKRDPIVRAVKRRLLASLGALKWDIKISKAADDKPELKQIADEQAKTLRAAYEQISNLRAALNFLSVAELRGYSHLEKIYRKYDSEDPDAADVIELRIVEQWFFCRDGVYGDWKYNPEAKEVNVGMDIDLDNFVIHAIDDPADEIFAELAVKRRVSDQDWDGFLEDYGIPPLFIKLPPNVPKEKEAEYQRAAELAVSAARGSLPNGASLETPSASGSGGAGVFKERLGYIDEQIVLAGTSGKLTVLSESGSGTLAGGAQKDAFDEIAQAIADSISEVLQKQFDKPLLDRKHSGQPVLAYFEFAPVDEKETAKHADNAVKFGQAGYAIDDAELSEKSGYKLRYVGAQAAHTNRPDGTKPIGVPGVEDTGAEKGSPSTEESTTAASTTATPPAAAPKKTPLSPTVESSSTSPVEVVASAAGVASQFVAPGRAIIDDLLARAADDSVGVDELTKAAEDLLKTIPELAEQTDLGSVIDALQVAMQKAAEATLAGSDAE